VWLNTGFVVWSETYDRSSGDLVAIQDDIATEVARSLKVLVEGGS
jgi:TolB-like protein